MSKILSKLSIIQQVDKLIELSFCLLFTGPSRLSSDQYLKYINSLSQQRFSSLPRFESESFWNLEMANQNRTRTTFYLRMLF